MAVEPCVDDFDNLPPALRSKLFSNLERFRLEQIRLAQAHPRDECCNYRGLASASPPPPAQPTPSNAHGPASTNPGSSARLRLPQSCHDLASHKKILHFQSQYKRLLLRNAARRNRLRKRNPPRRTEVLFTTQADSEWFRSLPRKIQERHFSSEEQAWLANGWRSSVILDAADKAFVRIGRQQKRRESLTSIATTPTLSSSETASTMSSSSHQPADPALDQNDSIYDSFRWLDEDDDLDLSLDNYHYHITDTPTATNKHIHERRSSFRRTFSFNSFQRNHSNHGTPSSSRVPTRQSFMPPQSKSRPPSIVHRREPSRSRTFSLAAIPKHASQSSITSVDQPAQYYQDPDARLKLRVYLASPQKFDEAVEFGFPSLEADDDNANSNNDSNGSSNNNNTTITTTTNKENRQSHRPSVRISTEPANEGTTFLEDGSTSYLDDMTPTNTTPVPADGPFSPTTTLNSPTTNPNSEVDSHRPSQSTSRPATTRQPRVVQPHRLSQSLAGGREMTLKMTLTRADLRTEDGTGRTSGFSDADDPLKLAELPAEGSNAHPIWDTPEEQNGGVVKRMWQKLKKRRT